MIPTNESTSNYNNGLKENLLSVFYLIKYQALDNMFRNSLDPQQKVIMYFDVKNVLAGLHREEEILNIIHDFKTKIDTTRIARTIIFLANHYARYFKKRNIDYNLVFFDDRGECSYHKKLSPKYKENRKQAKIKLSTIFLDELSLKDNFANIYDYSINVLSTMFKHMDNICFVNLKNLEADFVPYFMIKEEYLDIQTNKPDPKYAHIIVGNDKDFSQMLGFHNIFQIQKKSKTSEYELIERSNAMANFLKDKNKVKTLVHPIFTALMLAIAGDTADGISGVPGFGYVTTYKILNDLFEKNIITLEDNTAESFLFKLKEYTKISPKYSGSHQIKTLLSHENEILTNYKLVSFSALYNSLEYTKKKEIKDKYSKVINGRATKEQLIYNLKSICMYEGSYKSLL